MLLKVDKSTVVVFDLDDTLYKEIDFVYSAYAHICDSLIEPQQSASAFNQMVEAYHRGDDVFLQLKEQFKLSIAIVDLVQIYRFHPPQIKISKGGRELLTQLNVHGCRLGLITDGRERTQRNKLRALGIEPFFGGIVISETFGSEKPDERNYRFFENKYPSCRFIYIADNFRKDFVTPNRLGWTTIGLVDDGRNIHSQLIDVPSENKPHHLVPSLLSIVVKTQEKLGQEKS